MYIWTQSLPKAYGVLSPIFRGEGQLLVGFPGTKKTNTKKRTSHRPFGVVSVLRGGCWPLGLVGRGLFSPRPGLALALVFL